MFLVAVDATSKWIETHIVNSTTSTATVCKLREIFVQHRLPEIFVSDNVIINAEFETFMRKNGIVHITSAPCHPVCNGLAERADKTVISGITKTAGDNVETKLQRFLFDYMSYAVAIQDERECRRHVDHIRSRRADSDSIIPLYCVRENK